MSKVSIIIPLHNAEAYISETIQSCLAQTYTDIEIIVVENGSTDASYEKVAIINDARLCLFQISQTNAAAARNYGYLKSSGDYILFLDADDVMAANKIEAQLQALSQKENGWLASCAWAKFDEDITSERIEPQAVWRLESPIDWCVCAWTGGGMMIPGCWLIPRELIDRAGLWDERLTLHDDGEFMCRVLLTSKGNLFVDNTVVYYRQLEGSLSRQNNSREAIQSALQVYQSYEESILPLVDNTKIRFALAHNYRRLLYEVYPRHSEVIKTAEERLKALRLPSLPLVGGRSFRKLSGLLGFNNALRLRAIIRKWSYK